MFSELDIAFHFITQTREIGKAMVFSHEPVGWYKRHTSKCFISVFQVYNSNKDSQSEGSKYGVWIIFYSGVGLGL